MKNEPAYEAVHEVWHWVSIRVFDKRREQIVFQSWSNLTWQVRCKWAWYFRYRAALYQVQHPRCEVDLSWGNTPKGNQAEIQHLNKVRAKKAKITEVSSKIAKAREGWTQIFPIDQEPLYQRAMLKLELLQAELAELQNQSSQAA